MRIENSWLRRVLGAGCCMLACTLAAVGGEEIRTVEKDGITYRETTRTYQRPINETKYVDQEQTVYTPKVTVDTKPVTRSYLVPVTDWVAEPFLENRFNPFAQPYWSYHYAPRTRWETRTEEYKIQSQQREYVAEKRMVKVPVTTQRMVEDTVISRVALGSGAGGTTQPNTAIAGNSLQPRPASTRGALAPVNVGAPTATMATRPQMGGISRLETDPPRQGAGAATWKPADDSNSLLR